MVLDLLHFGSGSQATHYFVLCFAANLGTIQSIAARYNRRDLLWVEGRGGLALGAVMVAASFAWFFLVDEEIFIPGLAGGELFTIFIAGLVAAVPITRLIALVLAAVRTTPVTGKSGVREKEPSA